ncbi:Vacuolar protein 8 [Entomortierella beljakovae]|nr:Vacuolar protein 8 [Entomortierella beljakovae]
MYQSVRRFIHQITAAGVIDDIANVFSDKSSVISTKEIIDSKKPKVLENIQPTTQALVVYKGVKSTAQAYQLPHDFATKQLDLETIIPIIGRLNSVYPEEQIDALKILTKLAENEKNSVVIVRYGSARLYSMISTDRLKDIYVVNLIRKLSKSVQNIKTIGQSNLVNVIIALVIDDDVEVKRRALAILKSLTELRENRIWMLEQNVFKIFIRFLEKERKEFHHIIMSIICQFEFDYRFLTMLYNIKDLFIDSLIAYADSGNLLDARKAARIFDFFGSIYENTEQPWHFGHGFMPKFILSSIQAEIVDRGGFKCLNKLLLSEDRETYESALKCINSISNNSQHLLKLINPVIVERLKQLLLHYNLQEIVTSTLFRFSFHTHVGKATIFKAGIVQLYLNKIMTVNIHAQGLMIMTISDLAQSDKYRSKIVEMGALKIFILGLTFSNEKPRRHSIEALLHVAASATDHSVFINIWETPNDGLHGLLVRYIEGQDETQQELAMALIFTIWKNRKNIQLMELIKNSTRLKAALINAQKSSSIAKTVLESLRENVNENSNPNNNSTSGSNNNSNGNNSNSGNNNSNNNNSSNSNNKKKNKKKNNSKKKS